MLMFWKKMPTSQWSPCPTHLLEKVLILSVWAKLLLKTTLIQTLCGLRRFENMKFKINTFLLKKLRINACPLY